MRLVHDAIKTDDWRHLSKLIDDGLDIDGPITFNMDHRACTLLQEAASIGALEVIQGLVNRGANLEYRKVYGTALHCAVQFDRIEAVKLLLHAGADPNGRGPAEIEGDGNWTCLMCAILKKNDTVINTLLERGADPRLLSRKGIGTVSCAAENNDLELVERLLRAGASATNDSLFSAIDKVNDVLVNRLLAAGCKPNVAARSEELANVIKGETPLSFAILRLDVEKSCSGLNESHGRGEAKVQRLRKIIADLLSNGANPNERVGIRTPLSTAVAMRDLGLVELLLRFGADPSGPTFSAGCEYPIDSKSDLSIRETALQAAHRNGDEQIVDVLLRAGAK